MSKIEIIESLPTLTREERQEVRLKLAELEDDGWLDDDDPLTIEEITIIESRIAAHERDPGSAIPWEEFKLRITGGTR